MGDDVLDDILNWFHGLVDWIPGIGDMLADLLIGPIPKADEDAVYALAEQWQALAEELSAAYEDVAQMANPILESWSGDGAATQFVEEWFSYLEGLQSTAEGAGQMQQLTQNFGLEVELMKYMAVLNLIMLAVSIYIMIAAAGPTFGGSLGAAPGAFAATKIALQQAAQKTVGKIMSLVLRLSIKEMTKLFGKVAVAAGRRAAEIAAARRAIPTIIGKVATRLAETGVRGGLRDLARNIAARGISKAVANRLAAQALRGAAGRGLSGALAGQTRRAVQKELAKEIEKQLLKKWAGREIRRGTENALIRDLAASQVAKVALGREFAGYVGTRVAFGAGFMGGGNLLAQGIQIAEGNRQGIDWGQVGTYTLQGGAFGAGMFGGFTGHAIGGALAGGAFTLGQEAYAYAKTGDAIDWMAVGQSAAHGGVAGIVFGGQARLEHAQFGSGGLRVGEDVHVLPGGEPGSFTIVSARGEEGVAFTSDGQVAWQGETGNRNIPEGLQDRADVMGAIDQHWSPRETTITPDTGAPVTGGRADAPTGRVDPPARTDAGASTQTAGRGGGGGGSREATRGDGGSTGSGHGERVRVPAGDGAVPGDHTPSTAERSPSDTGAAGRPDTTADGDRSTARHPADTPRDGAPPGGGGPPRDGTSARPDQEAARTADPVRAQGDRVSPTGERIPAGGDRPPGERVAGHADGPPSGRAAEHGPTDRVPGDLVPADRGPGDRVPVDHGPGGRGEDGPARADRASDGRPGHDRSGAERADEHGPGERRRDDVAPPAQHVDGPARPETTTRTSEANSRTAARAEHRIPGEGERSRHGSEHTTTGRDNGDARPGSPHDRDHTGDEAPGAPRREDGPPHDPESARPETHHPDERLEDAGHETGVDRTDDSVDQGTVRYQDHPDFPRLEQELRDMGVNIHTVEKGPPNVTYRLVFDAQGREIIGVQKDMHLVRDMRFLDFEHELGHVRQMEDAGRFPDGPPGTSAVRQMPDGSLKAYKNAPNLIGTKIPVVEYHVRLQEVERLITNGVERGITDPAYRSIIDAHYEGLREYAEAYRDNQRQPMNKPAKWVNKHFGDILELRRKVDDLYAALENGGGSPGGGPACSGARN